jgi:hypothetical protein
MTNSGNNNMTRADLERLLDVFGSDRSRWPVDFRAGAGQLVARDKAARRLVNEAEALDRVLDRAPLPSVAREAALADRIIIAAQRSPRIVRIDGAPASAAAPEDEAGNVIAWPGSRAEPQGLRMSSTGRVAGLLAACLMFGVYIGVSNLTQGAIENITGASYNSGSNGATLAQLDPLDEDLL